MSKYDSKANCETINETFGTLRVWEATGCFSSSTSSPSYCPTRSSFSPESTAGDGALIHSDWVILVNHVERCHHQWVITLRGKSQHRELGLLTVLGPAGRRPARGPLCEPARCGPQAVFRSGAASSVEEANVGLRVDMANGLEHARGVGLRLRMALGDDVAALLLGEPRRAPGERGGLRGTQAPCASSDNYASVPGAPGAERSTAPGKIRRGGVVGSSLHSCTGCSSSPPGTVIPSVRTTKVITTFLFSVSLAQDGPAVKFSLRSTSSALQAQPPSKRQLCTLMQKPSLAEAHAQRTVAQISPTHSLALRFSAARHPSPSPRSYARHRSSLVLITTRSRGISFVGAVSRANDFCSHHAWPALRGPITAHTTTHGRAGSCRSPSCRHRQARHRVGNCGHQPRSHRATSKQPALADGETAARRRMRRPAHPKGAAPNARSGAS